MIINYHSGIQHDNFLERTVHLLMVGTALGVWEGMLFQNDSTHPHLSYERIIV
jgi:hypothetical protein